MKSIVFLIVALAVSHFSFAQNYSQEVVPWKFWRDFDIVIESRQGNKEQDLLKKNSVKSREKIRYYKGKPFSTIEYFNEEGKVVQTERTSKNGNKSTSSLTYTESGKLDQVEGRNYKDRTWKTTYLYDSKDRLIATESINTKQVYSKSEVGYNELDKISYRRLFDKKTDTPKKELSYTYHENGDKKETNYYEKGKLKHTWKFECKPEGELINVKEKDATKFCLIQDIDENGNGVIWERKFDEKGRLTKEKTVYTPDTLILLRQRFIGTDKLVYEKVNTFDDENQYVGSISKTFDKKLGLRLYSKTTFSKKKGTKTEHYNKKGELKYTKLYLSGSNGKPIKTQRIGKTWNATSLYHYNENDLISSEIRIYNRRTYVDEYSYEFF